MSDSFFKRPAPPTSPQQSGPAWTPPPRPRQAGDRSLVTRIDEPVPSHRKNGTGSRASVDRMPKGCIFKVPGTPGFFDEDGYWCVRKADGQVTVTRGAPKAIMRKLSKPQKKELARVRLQARRHGLR